jgi:hypothetical protein
MTGTTSAGRHTMNTHSYSSHTETSHPDGIAAVITTGDDLETVLTNPATYRMRGVVLVAPAALQRMEHIGLTATAIYNPFGPTVETLSLASFNGAWEEGRTVLLRRRLHPFSAPYIQVISEIDCAAGGWHAHLATVIALYLGDNGTSEASRGWSQPVHHHPPSGVLITEFGATWREQIGTGLAWAFRRCDRRLNEEIDRIAACGADFREQALHELHSVIGGRPGSAGPGRSGPTAARRETPCTVAADPGRLQEISRYTPSLAFTTWWDLVTTAAYQDALHQQLPAAWYGAVRHIPGIAARAASFDPIATVLGTAAPGGTGTSATDTSATDTPATDSAINDEFTAWWKLFAPHRSVH